MDDAITVDQGGTAVTLTGGASSVLANDTDPDSVNLTAAVVTDVTAGSLVLNADGTFSYTHNDSTTAVDSFTYQVCDDSAPALCDTANVAITITLRPSMVELTKTANLPTAAAGAALSYTLDLDNNGGQDATGVVLTETVPVGTQFDAANSDAGWSCAGVAAGSVCTLNVGTLVGLTSTSAVFAVVVDSPVAAGVETTSNAADVASSMNSDTASVTTTIDAAPDVNVLLSLTGIGSGGPGQLTVGSSVGLNVAYGNTGDQDTQGVVISVQIPPGFNNVAGPGWVCSAPDANGTACTLSVGDLNGGASAQSALSFIVADVVSGASVTGSIADGGGSGADGNIADNTSVIALGSALPLAVPSLNAWGLLLLTLSFVLMSVAAGRTVLRRP